MNGVFLLVSAFFAVVTHPNQPKAQNPNDPVYQNKPLSMWLKYLSDKDSKVRGRAAYAMRDLGPKAKPAVPTLFKMLREDPSPGPRMWAGYALSTVAPEDPAVPQALIQAMQNDTSKAVRWSTTSALSNMKPKPKAVVPELKKLLKSESPELRVNAIHALVEIEESEGMTPILIASLGDKDADVRETVAFRLGYIEDIVPTLRSLLRNDKPTVRAGASLALGRWGETCRDADIPQIKESLPSIIEVLKDKESYVRESAAQGLYRLGTRGITVAIPALISMLQDQTPAVRRWSVLALGQIGSDAHPAVAGLTKLLRDPSERVRQAAAAALGRIGPKAKSAVPELIVALEDADMSVPWAAAGGLAGIGPDAKEALPALRKAAKTENGNLEREATNALRNIDFVIDQKKDAETFDAIVHGWHEQFSGVNYPHAFIHTSNGPSGNWLHISVPAGLEKLYQHSFSREFLDERLKDKASFHQAVATDLLYLKQPILSKNGTGAHFFSVGNGNAWQCADYRVFSTWDYVCHGDIKMPDWSLED